MINDWKEPVIEIDDMWVDPFDDWTWKRTVLFCALGVVLYLGGVYLSTRGHMSPSDFVQGSAALTTPAYPPANSITLRPGGEIRVHRTGSPSAAQPFYLCGGSLVLNPGTWIQNASGGDIVITCPAGGKR